MGKKPRRHQGEGLIRQRKTGDGLWESRITLPDGRQKSFYGHSQEEVRRKLTAATRDRDRGLPIIADERQTVQQFLTAWLETQAPALKPRTWQRYEVALRKHLIPGLGRVRLSQLSAQQVQTFYAAKLKAGRDSAAQLSEATVAHLHAILHHALDDALRLGAVPRNVADLVTPPRARRREIAPLTPDQARQLLDAARGDRYECLYVLAVSTGMRLGELLALTWQDVDLDSGAVYVRHSLHHQRGGKWVLTTPKTESSRRRIRLSPLAIEALHAQRPRELAKRMALGPVRAGADHGFVFTRPTDSEPLRGTHLLAHHFRPLLKRAGLPAIRFHDLRHTAATLALIEHLPTKMVSEMLGHSSTAITDDLYAHMTPDAHRDVAEAMQRILTRQPKRKPPDEG